MTQTALLAIDVGGSNTRAFLVSPDGHCLGHGRNRGGNPASNNPEFSASSIIAAVQAAVAEAGSGPWDIKIALLALAGPQKHLAVDTLKAAFRELGLSGSIIFAGDVLAMFASVTLATDGYCVVSGTGAGAIGIRGAEIDRVVDLAGWLLGDFGSGYWIGHAAAKAVVADMEGRGDATALTPELLSALNIEHDAEGRMQGRTRALRHFIDAVYALRPIELARFAPLVVAHRDDPIANRLLAQAERYLIDDFATAYDASVPGPIALGGGVMPHLPGVSNGIAEIVRGTGHQPFIHLVKDGSVGAVVLALRAAGMAVNETTFNTIKSSLTERIASANHAPA